MRYFAPLTLPQTRCCCITQGTVSSIVKADCT